MQFRISVDSRFDLELRFQVLEMIELQASGWILSDDVEAFYKDKVKQYSKQNERKENPEAVPKLVENSEKRKPSLFTSKLHVGGVEIIVKSKSKVLMERSRKALRGYFFMGNTENRVFKYSKEQILALSSFKSDTNNWKNVINFIPKYLVKPEHL